MSLKEKAIKGGFWVFVQQFGSKGTESILLFSSLI